MSTLFDRGWQQPLNCHKAQPAHRVKDAEGKAKPLVLDSVRWLCYPAAMSARISRAQMPAIPVMKQPLLTFNNHLLII